jgi:hypothetical protein
MSATSSPQALKTTAGLSTTGQKRPGGHRKIVSLENSQIVEKDKGNV